MNKKYEFTSETKTLPDGRTLHRIKSLITTEYADAGELGGFIEKEANLPHNDISWVANEAMVYGEAVVIYDSIVSDHAIVCDHAVICFGAKVSGHAHISGFSKISGLTSVITGRCSLDYFTSAKDLHMECNNHVIRKGKSDSVYSKSDIDYSKMIKVGNHRFLKDAILAILTGTFGGIAIGSLLLIFN